MEMEQAAIIENAPLTRGKAWMEPTYLKETDLITVGTKEDSDRVLMVAIHDATGGLVKMVERQGAVNQVLVDVSGLDGGFYFAVAYLFDTVCADLQKQFLCFFIDRSGIPVTAP